MLRFEENQQASSNDPLEVLIGPITRFKTKNIKKKFNGVNQDVWVKKLQIWQTKPLYVFWILYELTCEILFCCDSIWAVN